MEWNCAAVGIHRLFAITCQMTGCEPKDDSMRRHRNVKIVATLGPASNDYAMIRALHEAGADVFRLNMSHGAG